MFTVLLEEGDPSANGIVLVNSSGGLRVGSVGLMGLVTGVSGGHSMLYFDMFDSNWFELVGSNLENVERTSLIAWIYIGVSGVYITYVRDTPCTRINEY